MEARRRTVASAVPDASLVARWHTPHEPGWEHASRFADALAAGTIRFAAPEHLKVEVVRVLQLGVRDKRYSLTEGLDRVRAFQSLPLRYVANDLLFADAFRLASALQMALYDTLYVALAAALDVPFVTADRRTANLARQRGLATVAWYEDVVPAGT